jgi:hypothetical protein
MSQKFKNFWAQNIYVYFKYYFFRPFYRPLNRFPGQLRHSLLHSLRQSLRHSLLPRYTPATNFIKCVSYISFFILMTSVVALWSCRVVTDGVSVVSRKIVN